MYPSTQVVADHMVRVAFEPVERPRINAPYGAYRSSTRPTIINEVRLTFRANLAGLDRSWRLAHYEVRATNIRQDGSLGVGRMIAGYGLPDDALRDGRIDAELHAFLRPIVAEHMPPHELRLANLDTFLLPKVA